MPSDKSRFVYRKCASHYRMLLLSRRQAIPSGFTVERHADDYAWAMELLELSFVRLLRLLRDPR